MFNFLKLIINCSVGASLLTANMSLAMADAPPPSNDSYPYVAPNNCQFSVAEPDESNGYYLSKGCGNILVLPPRFGTMKVEHFAANEGLKLCSLYDTNIKLAGFFNSQIEKLKTAIDKLAVEDPKAKDLRDQVIALGSEVTKAIHAYDGLEGATIDITFELPTGRTVQDFIKLNGDKATVTRAPISEGYLSFTRKTKDAADTVANAAVMSSTIVGLATRKGDASAVASDGTAKGQVVLSLAGACPVAGEQLRKLANSDDTSQVDLNSLKVNTQDLDAHLVVNYTYTVPVKTLYGFHAELKAQNSLQALVTSRETRTQFTIAQARQTILEGSNNEAFKFSAYGYEQKQQPKDDPFYIGLQEAILEEMVAELLTNVSKEGLISMISSPPPTAPSGGTVQEPVSVRTCQRENFGLWMGNDHCENTIAYVPSWRDGAAFSDNTLIDRIGRTVVRDTAIDGVLYRVHTATYVNVNKN